MIFKAQQEWQVDLAKSYVVGDRWRDIDAGHAAGCRTIWMDYGYAEALRTPPDYQINRIEQLLDIIL